MRGQPIGKLPGENFSGEEVHDRLQDHETYAHQGKSGIRHQTLFNGCYLDEDYQTGEQLRRTAWDGRSWFLLDHP